MLSLVFWVSLTDVDLAPLVQEVLWSHNLIIVQKLKSPQERELCLQMTTKESWGKRYLTEKIKSKVHLQSLEHQNNFPIDDRCPISCARGSLEPPVNPPLMTIVL